MLQIAQRVTKRTGKPITESYVSMIETGHRNPPRKPLLGALAKALGVSEDVLEYAAKGQLYRPIVEVLQERNASPELIETLQAHASHQLNYINDVLRAVPGIEIVVLIRPDGTVDIAVIEDLQ